MGYIHAIHGRQGAWNPLNPDRLDRSDQNLTLNDRIAGTKLHIVNAANSEDTIMHGRPKLGKHRMVTVATRIEPDEAQQLRNLADECGMSLCGYMRELVRRELGRAGRTGDVLPESVPASLNGSEGNLDAVA